MAKASEPKKPAAKATAKTTAKTSVKSKTGSASSSNETPVSSKENPSPAKSKTGNTSATRPPAQAQGKATPSTKAGAKKGDHTEATGRDHPSQSEHAKALWQKLHGTSEQRAKGTGAPGGPPGGAKKGFDPKQFKSGGKNFGGAGNQMLRRTQGKGGGGGGGAGGGAGG